MMLQKTDIIAITLLAVGMSCFTVTSYYTYIDMQKYPQKAAFEDTAFPKRALNDTQQYHVVQMGGNKTLFIASIVLVPAGIAMFFYRKDCWQR